MDKTPSDHFDTLAIHAGQDIDPSSGAVMPAITLSSTFAQSAAGEPGRFEYSRSGNPTRAMLEACLAALEGGRYGLAFASGSAATSAVLQTLQAGDEIIVGDDVYGGTYRLLERVFRPQGIVVRWVDTTDVDAVRAQLSDRTRMCWLETPTNPLLKLTDIAAVAELCQKQQIKLIVDNTFATPALQRPLDLGADAVVHSTTKYLNGHSDAIGGAIITSDPALAERLAFLQNAVGAVPSPFDCYLVLRGLKTLPLRMQRHCDTASMLASRLQQHPAVTQVHYPGLPDHPQAAIARKQMAAAGGMVSFELAAGLSAARTLTALTRLFVCAESLGGVESLIEVPALMTHASIPAETRAAVGIADGLVRLSVGLEHRDDLMQDLEQALSRL